MGKRLYVGTTDYTRWADFSTLQDPTLTAGQGVVEQFSVALRNYAPIDAHGIGGVLPALPAGHVPVLWINVIETVAEGDPPPPPPFDEYEILFGGILLSVDGSDADWQGATVIHVATPMKLLKIVIAELIFQPDPGLQPTDTSRIRYIGSRLADQLPDFDFDRYVAPDVDGNITYPLPTPALALHNDGTDADAYTKYSGMTVEDIVRAISTDPGWFSDSGYPVGARNWWIDADFITAGIPSSGIKFFVHYQNVPVAADVVDLLGAPDPALPDAALYEQGSSYTVDYTKVIRQINIAGPSSTPGSFYNYQPVLVTAFSCGLTGMDKIALRGNILWKKAGTDGVWDAGGSTGAWANDPLPPHDPKFLGFGYDDLEVSAQIQEIYLEHDNFQRAAGPPTASASGASGGLGQTLHYTWWDNLDANAPMHIRNGHAATQFLRSPTTGGLTVAFGILECNASSVVLRTKLALNRKGMALIFRFQDYYHFWCVRAESSGYSVCQANGGAPVPVAGGTISVARADMQEIKVSLKNEGDTPYDNAHSQIDVYIDNVHYVYLEDNTYCMETRAGLHVDCGYALEAYDGEFYDFQATSFYGDRAFGIGNADMFYNTGGPPHNAYTNPSWIYISYGTLFRSDGLTDLIHDGNPLNHDQWEPTGVLGQTQYDINRGYTYNDRFKVLVVKYADPSTGALLRKAQWLKQPDGGGTWLLLAEMDPITEPDGPDLAHPWCVQIAYKDMGCALSNITAGKSWSNMFYAPDSFSPLYGGNRRYPATQVLQNDTWTTYAKRKRVADAIFRAEGEPPLTFDCVTLHHFQRGDFARITNRRAGWVATPADTRKTLMCVSSQRVETTSRHDVAGRSPKYKCTFGQYIYSSDDPGRTHLLAPMTQESFLYDPPNLLDPDFDGMALTLNDAAVVGMQNENQQLQMQLIPQDQQAAESAMWPMIKYDVGTRKAMLPVYWFPPNTQLVMRHRVISAAGVGQWSTGLPFTTPPQIASDRASVVMWYLGDGANPLAADDVSDEIVINGPCRIVGWAADLADQIGDMQYDIQWCTAAARRANGVSAFATISASGAGGVFISSTINDGTYNDNFNMTDWDPAAFSLQTGDRLRIHISAAATTATKGTVDLYFAPLKTPFTQAAGRPVGPPP